MQYNKTLTDSKIYLDEREPKGVVLIVQVLFFHSHFVQLVRCLSVNTPFGSVLCEK
jgi:hypothetical protein